MICVSPANEEKINDVLSHITEGVCRPLKVRLEQVVVSEPGPVLLYKLTNLLKFYHITIGSVTMTYLLDLSLLLYLIINYYLILSYSLRK